MHSIQNALAALSPAPSSVDVSIVTQTVTVKHPADLFRAAINEAIDEAGFDIVSDPDDNGPGSSQTPHTPSTPLVSLALPHNLARLGHPFSGKKQKHLDQCAACQAEQRESLEQEADSASIAKETIGEHSTTGDVVLFPISENATAPAGHAKKQPSTDEVVPLASEEDRVPQYVTLSIGGMTCASCSNAVTRALSELPGASDVVVNLLGNSATLKLDRASLVPSVTETVEDIGYEAEVISVEPLSSPSPRRTAQAAERKAFQQQLTLSVGGMTCAACSNTVTDVLKRIPGVVDPIVNLLGASATMVVDSKDMVPQVVEAIEDAGYEAEVNSVEPVISDKNKEESEPRTVALRVDGMFCRYVPPFSSYHATHQMNVATAQRKS